MNGIEPAAILARSIRAHALGARAANVLDAVRRAAGVYGSAPACHLSVQARTSGFTPQALEQAIHRARALVRVHAMRGSIYLMPREHVFHALALGRIRSIA
ncbi:MAG: crosslink repair DNA glycosylase YcaQ family protein, partial [Bryobacteraceae bacterium]